jgi:uncharacterized membrane protein YagU involved in acid resistance
MSRFVNAILASLAGGIVFGVLMQMMGMMSGIATMVGSQSIAVGWMVHLMISALFGVGWLLFAGETGGAWRGLLYGVVLWILGPLVIMPAMMGAPLLQLNQAALISLMGHLVYGLVTGIAFQALTRRAGVERRV